MSDTRESAALVAAFDRLMVENEIAEAVKQYCNGRQSVGPKLIRMGINPRTGERLATSPADAPPPRPWSDGRRRRTLDRHERITSAYQTVNGQPVRPLATLKAPPPARIYVPSSHR